MLYLVYFQLLDMKVFVDTDSDERLVRRLQRDISERGRDLDGVLKQYFKFVKPAFDYYIAPSMVSHKTEKAGQIIMLQRL